MATHRSPHELPTTNEATNQTRLRSTLEEQQPFEQPPIRTFRDTAPDQENDLEDVLYRHVTRHVAGQRLISEKRLQFEQVRPKWYREMAAETIGVFLFVYPGIASQASLLSSQGNATQSSTFQIGWGYAMGMAFAVIACATTSGGHFSPALTLCFATWQGFPWRKVPLYIVAQVLGALLAGLVLTGQYREQFRMIEERLSASGQPLIGPQTPAAMLAPFPARYQSDLSWLFLIEFFASSFVALVVWSVLDPANPFITPQSAPFVIGLAYGVMYWGFLDVSVSLNTAKDLGLRTVAAVWYGRGAFTYMHYTWIPIFVNIPATLLGTTVYEIFLRDSLDRIGLGRAQYEGGDEGLRRYLVEAGLLGPGVTNALRRSRQ